MAQQRVEQRRRALFRPRWLLLTAITAMFVAALITNGLATSQVGIDAAGAAPERGSTAVPDEIRDGGPVIDLTEGRVSSLSPAPRSVALTFDDGPDPEWTPQVLAVLAKHRVPGTFFVLGSRVARYPDLARAIAASGSEIGLHTFTHPDLSLIRPRRVDQEIATTQLAVAGATGRISYLVRPPYSSTADAVDDSSFAVLRRLGAAGYVTALVDSDTEDWTRPGVDAIADAVRSAAERGGIVLLHDAGGDRSQTVAALDRVIPELQAAGVTFTTVTGAVGLPPADSAAGPAPRAVGTVMMGAVATARAVADVLEVCLLVTGVLVLARLLVMSGVAIGHARRRRRTGPLPPWPDPVSVVVPAHNESRTIAATVRSLVAGTHPVEVIVVDDGSTDGTADVVRALGLPGVRVVRQPNAGKPAALNTGIAAASHEIVIMVDGDTVFERTSVARLAARFADPEVGAVAGNARVADRRSLIARWQHIEYVIGFNIDRRVQDRWQAITTVPGAIGAYRRSVLGRVGGVSEDTLAEDTDLTIAIGRAGWRIVYEPDARAWTDAPSRFPQLWRQRYRWSYGVMQSLWKHRHAVVEPGRSGRIGRRGLVVTGLFQIVLPLAAPMIDVYLVYGLVFLDPLRTAAWWGAALLVQWTAGVIAFRLDREPLRDLWLLPLQQLVYRQLMYAVLVQSVLTALAGTRMSWQKVPRAGRFSAAPDSAALTGSPGGGS